VEDESHRAAPQKHPTRRQCKRLAAENNTQPNPLGPGSLPLIVVMLVPAAMNTASPRLGCPRVEKAWPTSSCPCSSRRS
jgi:hypothetical protein